MQKQLSWLLLAALVLTAVAACKKSTEEPDTNAPVLTITSPAADASISGPVSITGKATDESMHELVVQVHRDSDNTLLYTQSPTVHDLTQYDINFTWTPAGLSGETPVTLTITVEDHSNHTTTQSVKFSVKP